MPSATTTALPPSASKGFVERRQAERRLFRGIAVRHPHRRGGGRRDSDFGPLHRDHYRFGLSMVAIALVILSAMDATFTLFLIDHGAVELNSLMASLIERGEHLFVGTKLALTALAGSFLVLNNDFPIGRWLRVKHVAVALMCGYLTLIVYELHLISLIA